jgi:single-stranded-DNA-specific exonuclease
MTLDSLGSKRWRIATPAPADFISGLPQMHPALAQVLYNRGVRLPREADVYLSREVPLGDPLELEGMAEAVAVVRHVIAQGERIVIYGDYDVDGVTAVAVLVETLQTMGAHVDPYIPSRQDEGYGLNLEAIRTLAQFGTGLLITADCGTRSVDEITLARELGMHVVVTDHHQLGSTIPPADALINPKRTGSSYPFTELAGVGVAFKLAQALIAANQIAPLPTTQSEFSDDALLELVALGTVADMVPLRGENHTLVSRGLRKINSGHRPGLSAMLRIAGADPGKVTTKTIGFVLSPRLNSAGRIGEASIALDLLLAPDMASALPLAQELDTLNQKRREITTEVHEGARDIVVSHDSMPSLIFAASDSFPSGVVGLAANRLMDEFYRPAVVVSMQGDYSKGSARSIPEFNITEALDTFEGLLERHGGHAAAAGFTVQTSRLRELESCLVALADEQLGDLVLVPTLSIDAEVPLADLSWELYNQLEQLQPFGFGNAVPVFVSRHVRVLSARAVGVDGRHLKLYVADASGRSWDAIAFRQGYWIGRVPPSIDLAYRLELNEWNGRINLQLNVQNIHVPDGANLGYG